MVFVVSSLGKLKGALECSKSRDHSGITHLESFLSSRDIFEARPSDLEHIKALSSLLVDDPFPFLAYNVVRANFANFGTEARHPM